MATTIFPRPADEPPLDAVLFSLTRTTHADYTRRGVFPKLSPENAVHVVEANGAMLFYLTRPEAEAVLADARAQHQVAYKGMRNAYKGVMERLKQAIAEASERPSIYNASQAVLVERYCYGVSESWRGTKEQLQAMGIGAGVLFPGEPNAKRWMFVRDRRGYRTKLSRYSDTWPGLYWAGIEYPQEVKAAERAKEKLAEDQAAARRTQVQMIERLPQTPEALREHIASTFWHFVNHTLDCMRPAHGYRFTEDAKEEFKDAASDAFWALKNGDTEGRSPREDLTRLQATEAKADVPLQAFLASIAKNGQAPNDDAR